MHTTGLDHVTLIGSDEADTVAFYRDLPGIPLVLRQSNLDASNVTHLFFDTGDGRILTFFVEEGRQPNPSPSGRRSAPPTTSRSGSTPCTSRR